MSSARDFYHSRSLQNKMMAIDSRMKTDSNHNAGILSASLINQFRFALYQPAKVAKTLWDNNPALQAWYLSKPVQLLMLTTTMPTNTNNSQIHNSRVIPLQELAKDFISLLKNGHTHIIRAIWNKNALFRSWYCGETVNFVNAAGQMRDCVISDKELVKHFLAVLNSLKTDMMIIDTMWKKNHRLHHCIKALSFEESQSTELLIKVMTVCPQLNELIIEYVNNIDDIDIIHEALRRMARRQNKSSTAIDPEDYQKRVALLEHRANQLSIKDDSSSQTLSDTSINPLFCESLFSFSLDHHYLLTTECCEIVEDSLKRYEQLQKTQSLPSNNLPILNNRPSQMTLFANQPANSKRTLDEQHHDSNDSPKKRKH